MKHILTFLTLFLAFTLQSQSVDFELPITVKANGNPADPSAMMDIESSGKGVLIPRLTTAQRNAIVNPATGLILYDTDTNVFMYYNSTSWTPLLATSATVQGAGDMTVTENAGIFTVTYNDPDKDNTNEVQFISKNANLISLSSIESLGGGTVTLLDDDPLNEIQDLIYNYANNTLTISSNAGANVIDFSGLDVDTDDQSLGIATFNDVTNTLMMTIEDGSGTSVDLSGLEESVVGNNDITVTESNGVFTVDYIDSDKDASNEIQDLDFNSTTKILKVTNNNNATDIDLSDSFETVVGADDISVTQNSGEYTVSYVDGDKSETNEAQTISKNGADISLSMANGAGGGTITLNDDSSSNEIQDLSYNPMTNILKVTNNTGATDIDLTELEESVEGNNDITVTESNGVYTVDYTDGDKSDVNEAQFLFRSFDEITLTPANNIGGGSFTLNDDNPTNEIQTISRAGLDVMLTGGGTFQDSVLSEAIVDTYADNNGYLTTEVDGSITNEIQSISRTGLNVTLTDGGTYQDSVLSEAIVDAYADNNGYLQTISRTGLTVSLVDGGTYQDSILSEATVDSYADNNGYLISEVDGSVTNEIQDLEYNAMTNTLKVTNNTSATDINLSGLQDDLGDHTATEDVILDSNTIKLKDDTDTNNALRYAGSTSMFNNYNPDGPVLYGKNGGALGTTNSQDSIIVSWNENGRVGINTTNPSSELDVKGNISLSHSTDDEMIIKNESDWTHSSGNQNMSFGGDGGDHFIIASKEGSAEGSGIYGDADHMTIWASGEDIENPNAFLYIVDTDKMDNDNDPYDNSAVVAYLNSSGNWVSASDQNRKENIEQLQGSLEKILNVNGYSYEFKRTAAEKERGMQAPHALGVIAQEVKQVIPEVVETKSNGEEFVSYTEFIPLLIESIKEQQAQIEALKSEVKTLKEGK